MHGERGHGFCRIYGTSASETDDDIDVLGRDECAPFLDVLLGRILPHSIKDQCLDALCPERFEHPQM